MHQLGYINGFDVWVPHKLIKKNLLDAVSACSFLLKHNKILFLKQIVMADEKCILYNNVDWERFGGK